MFQRPRRPGGSDGRGYAVSREKCSVDLTVVFETKVAAYEVRHDVRFATDRKANTHGGRKCPSAGCSERERGYAHNRGNQVKLCDAWREASIKEPARGYAPNDHC